MDDEALAKLALQKILDYQMPTGEWGYYSLSLKHRYQRVKREEYTRPEYLHLFRKPNVYRTLTAMESLRDYCGNMFNSRIRMAIAWLNQNLYSGWFIEWDSFGSGFFPNRIDLPHVEKAPDIRHTAQALLGLLKFDRHPNREFLKGLYNILNHQFESGMWPRKPGFNHVEIFRSVCCADLLFHATDYRYRRKLSKLGLDNDFIQKARVALDRTCAWLVDCAEKHNGLWMDEYQTAMVLERLGRRLLADRRYYSTVELAVGALLERMIDEGWTNSAIVKPEIRYSEVSRYETTVRVCASLCVVRGDKLWIPDEVLEPVRGYLYERFRPDVIDASDYRYFLQIFYPDSYQFRSVTQPENFFDCFDRNQAVLLSSNPSRDSLLRTMSLWVSDCLGRLERLAEGKALGLPGYDQAYLEKEDELLSILDTMHLISAEQPIGELPLSLLQYFETGDLQPLREQLESFSNEYQLQIEKGAPLEGRVYQEVKGLFIEIVVRYLELISKP
ncbi:MAG: hypothetical protein JSV36_06565 [Anaerolineae bacterium]|nr:MAG: hypothetical protein JSV36_06565 [Anaerolineae bacterium]